MANYSARRVYWPTQETVTDFPPTSENSAGSFDIATEGLLVCGRATKTETLIWSTVDLWAARYVGAPFFYAFDKKGSDCGIMSQNAVVMIGDVAFWMGPKKQFFRFDGFVKDLTPECEVTDYVFGSFNMTYAHLVFGFSNSQFSEVTWHYPSANSTTCDRYVTYNYAENHWVFGILSRCCAVTSQAGATTPVPVLLTTAGTIYDHETGTTLDSAAYLDSGPVEVGQGDNVVKIQRIVPDEETAGDVTLSLLTSLFPNGTETTNGPYTLSSPTSIRLTARQVRLRFTQVASAAFRIGVFRLGIIISGRR